MWRLSKSYREKRVCELECYLSGVICNDGGSTVNEVGGSSREREMWKDLIGLFIMR